MGSQRRMYSAPKMAITRAARVRLMVATAMTPPGRTSAPQAARKAGRFSTCSTTSMLSTASNWAPA